LAGYYKSLFQKNCLVDFVPVEIVPTWKNGRVGDDNIAKQLDRIYIAEDILTNTQRFRT
jgi:hypothetical protein